MLRCGPSESERGYKVHRIRCDSKSLCHVSSSALKGAETTFMMTESPRDQDCRLFIGWREFKQTRNNISSVLA